VGFVYIAGALRQAGFTVEYYDAMSLWHGWDEIAEHLENSRPHVVATTAYTASVIDALALLRLAKEIDPCTITVLGNVHATFCYEEIFKTEGDVVDYIVRGEGEHTLPKLLDCLNEGDDPSKVEGIVFRRDGGVWVTPKAPYIDDLDLLTPAWDLVQWPIYTYRAKHGARLAVVSSSRGCQQQCSFCSQQLFWSRSWRARSPENFVNELEMLHYRFGVEVAMLSDEIPTLDRQRWERILSLMINRQVPVKLLMETRVDDILRDEDIMESYREGGVEHIYVGVEAGSQSILDLFKKDTLVGQSKRAIELINGADIVSETSFVLGLPDESADSIAATVELAKHYDPDMAFFLAIAPWPYADLYPTLEPFVASKDYKKYNLVEPIVKPHNMSIAEVEAALARSSQQFFMHKFKNLHRLSSWKQEFMLAVLNLLINHSYLAEQMRAVMREGAQMPEEVKEMLRVVGQQQKMPASTLAPLP
jgi:anaerobic magnesium-protoporphyrin IX monomethyl ester cyclase